MIVTFFLQIAYSFLNFLVGLLPTGGSFPASWTSGIATVWGAVNVFSFIVPVGVLVTALGIAVTFHLFVFSWKFLHWLWSLIRGGRVH
jgi:uncharacterized membrane protein YdfJ with MMPL/SSD domain